MRIKRLIGGVCVAGAAVFAACFGGQPQESSTEQLVLQSSPMQWNFGTVNVGADSAPHTFVISNDGFGEIDILQAIGPSAGSCPEFIPTFNPPPNGYVVSNCGSGTGGSASGATGSDMCFPTFYSFDVKFHPTAAGSAGCTYNVSYTPGSGGSGSSFPITLSGNGMAAPNMLSISPTQPINFGDIPNQTDSAARTVQVTNTGGNTLSVTPALSGGFFTVMPTPAPFTLMPMQSQQFQVKCHPPAGGGGGSGSLTFSSAAPTVGVQLGCNGIMPTGLTVHPVPSNFPSTLVGAGVDVELLIDNTTGTQVTLNVALTSTAGSEVTLTADPNGMTLGSGSSATARLHYAAATERTFSQVGTITVGYTGAAQAQSVVVNAEALTGSLGMSPGSTVDFGPVCVGGTASKDITLYASGLGAVDITGVQTPAAPFTATQPTGTLDGNHGSTKTLTVGVAPSAAGDLASKATVQTNIPNGGTLDVMLAAKALPAGVTPTPDAAHFGPGRVMMTSQAKEIIVTNCAGAPVDVTAARIEGPSAAEFALVSPLPPAPVETKAGASFLVVMTPRSNGQKAAQLVIDTSGGTMMVPLDGNGFGGGDGDTDDKATYYTCSAGGPAGAGTLALVLGLALRAGPRRRRRSA